MTTTEKIELDHGTGALLSQKLVAEIAEILGDVYLGEMEDSAIVECGTSRIAMTTDSFVVDPILFGNGDIGKIAICGTVNDLAVAGARPLYLSLAMILETGLPMQTLRRILVSIRDTATEAGVKIVCGDTKVVRSGEADGIYINTTGIGALDRDPLRMASVRVGDRVIVSGYLGNHTVHLLSIREGLGFEERVLSDCAPLNGMIEELLDLFPDDIRSIRDVTRGGLNAVLNEYADKLGKELRIDGVSLPIQAETAMAADMLGIDPLNCANEGCIALFVDAQSADSILATMRRQSLGKQAAIVGEVVEANSPRVMVRSADGQLSRRAPLRGAELPRLC